MPTIGEPRIEPYIDERTYLTMEAALENQVEKMREEIEFLREMLRLALAHNTGTERP